MSRKFSQKEEKENEHLRLSATYYAERIRKVRILFAPMAGLATELLGVLDQQAFENISRYIITNSLNRKVDNSTATR